MFLSAHELFKMNVILFLIFRNRFVIIILAARNAGLAQPVEHLIRNHEVVGSSPTSSSKISVLSNGYFFIHISGVLRFVGFGTEKFSAYHFTKSK